MTGQWHECPVHGIEHVHWNWGNKTAGQLWDVVNYMIWSNRFKSDKGIIDEMMDYKAHVDPFFTSPLL